LRASHYPPGPFLPSPLRFLPAYVLHVYSMSLLLIDGCVPIACHCQTPIRPPAAEHSHCAGIARAQLLAIHCNSFCIAFVLQFILHLCAGRWKSPWRCTHASTEADSSLSSSAAFLPHPSVVVPFAVPLYIDGVVCSRLVVSAWLEDLWGSSMPPARVYGAFAAASASRGKHPALRS